MKEGCGGENGRREKLYYRGKRNEIAKTMQRDTESDGNRERDLGLHL